MRRRLTLEAVVAKSSKINIVDSYTSPLKRRNVLSHTHTHVKIGGNDDESHCYLYATRARVKIDSYIIFFFNENLYTQYNTM